MQETANDTAKIALFWDKSFLWGLIAYDTFRELGIDFELLTSEDVRAGRLAGFDVLFVPGGWASDKIVALGAEGRERIRDFVSAGGSYLGICGGAGLALSHENGLGLSVSGRLPSNKRLPSFSGAIHLEAAEPGHPLWEGSGGSGIFHAWWPGQFSLEEGGGDIVLARYGSPVDGSCVTDLPVYEWMDWAFWGQKYGINLNPERIVGEPAVIETRFGEGKAILSYLHFETPADSAGHDVLLNILRYLAGGKSVGGGDAGKRIGDSAKRGDLPVKPAGGAVSEAAVIAGRLKQSADKLVEFGEKNFLWYQRNSWILQWRRGVRGVEYSTLDAMLARIAELTAKLNREAAADFSSGRGIELAEKLQRLVEISNPFFSDARTLLMLEREALTQGPISPLKTGDGQIQELRERLFSNSKRCGGLYEEVIELADEILLPLLRAELGHNLPA